MSLAENLADLEMHERDFENRAGFTYTVLDPESGDVIGCVYIYPLRRRNDDGTAAEPIPAQRPFARGCARTGQRSTSRSGGRSARGSGRSGRSSASSTRPATSVSGGLGRGPAAARAPGYDP